jgi:ribosome-binding ATPase YchF (GTP1/OBG family)
VKTLEAGLPARSLALDADEIDAISDIHLITMKKMLYVCNVDEGNLLEENEHVKKVREIAAKEGSKVITICGKIESEIAALESKEEKEAFFIYLQKALDKKLLNTLKVVQYEQEKQKIQSIRGLEIKRNAEGQLKWGFSAKKQRTDVTRKKKKDDAQTTNVLKIDETQQE